MAAPTHRMVVVWNEAAGSAEGSAAVREELAARPDTKIVESRDRGDAIREARLAAESGAQIVVAAGGDGTINSVLQGIVEHRDSVTLGILPIGTGNDLCRSLGIPRDPDEAMNSLFTEEVRRLDLAYAESAENRTWFINMAAGGNSGRFSKSLSPDMKRFWGPLCYLRGAVDVLSDLTVFNLSVAWNGEKPQAFEALNMFVANGATLGGGLHAAPHADLEDGLLELVIVLDGDAIDLTRVATQFVVSNYLDSDHIVYRRVKAVEFRADPEMTLALDGDIPRHDPFSIRCVPSALNVIVGPEYERPEPPPTTKVG